jgi:N-acylneuraminate cytidylyltransferase/CMP-N,N'-diacetyllegionaminic acid synthase
MEPLMAGARPSRRQDTQAYAMLNGAVFVARWDWLKRHDDFVGDATLAYAMPKHRSVDVDDELDLALADALLARRRRRPTSSAAATCC